MEEEKPFVPEISPLRWPGGSRPLPIGSITLNPNKRRGRMLGILDKEVAARPPIPPEVWGPDPRRQRMGSFISDLIADRCMWSASRFVPDDPFEIISSPHAIIDDSDMEIIEGIEEEILCDLHIPKRTRKATSGTLGDFVDYCLSLASNWPIEEWSPDPTGRICPTFSAFYDIRRFVCSRYSLERKAIRPSTQLSTCRFRKRNGEFFNDYLEKRFGKRPVVSRYFLGLFHSEWIWLAFFGSLYCNNIIYHNAPLIGGWVLFTAIITGIVVYFLSWQKCRRGLRTFRDLVEYVVEESQAKTPVAGEK